MKTIERADEMRQFVNDQRRIRERVGIVPTMGALHQGHLSLVQRSISECQATVVTIFVNPTQFGPQEDFQEYPRTLDDDLAKLKSAGVDAVYVPTAGAMYPQGFSTFVNPPDVALTLEGNHRPGHFQGVCTVVLKLFHAVPATHAYFGMKDYQQFKVISAMVADLDLGLSVVGCDIFREPDGLAMSSRNRYLSSAERAQALVIQRSLSKALASWREGQSVRQIEEQLHADLLSGTDGAPGLDRIDYAKIVDADTLEPTRSMIPVAGIALVAGFVGKTRLIDNQLLPRRERPADR